jgi:cysteine synthase A
MSTESGNSGITASALDLVGNTPLLALDRLWPGPGRILAKCEFLNPGGSVKDRSSLSMIREAKASGKLAPNANVLEVTSGNQGCGLAMVCTVLGHPLTVTMSKGNSPQRATMMKALGAEVILVDQVEGTPGNVTLADVNAAEARGLAILKESGAYYVDQFNNDDNINAHVKSTGPEIWSQTGGKIDVFLATVGTAGTFMGVSRFLKSKNPKITCVAVEPQGAEVIEGKEVTKPCHLLQGSGYGAVPRLFKFDTLDFTLSVTDKEAVEYKKLLGSKEGVYCGYTSGANVAAAVKLLQSGKIPADSVVVTVLNDTGLKYPEKEYNFE